MSMKIDLTKQLTELELRYLVDRDRWEDIRENAENIGADIPDLPSARGLRAQLPRQQLRNSDDLEKIAKQLGVTLTDPEDEEDLPASAPQPASEQRTVNYNELTVPQLKEELDKRRADYERVGDDQGVALVSYEGSAKKGDLVALLELDDDETSDEPDNG